MLSVRPFRLSSDNRRNAGGNYLFFSFLLLPPKASRRQAKREAGAKKEKREIGFWFLPLVLAARIFAGGIPNGPENALWFSPGRLLGTAIRPGAGKTVFRFCRS